MTKRVSAEFAICKLCERKYSIDEAVTVLGQLAPGEDASSHAGTDVELDLCGLPVSAMRVGPDSPAREQGFDVLVIVCSWECVTAIRLAADLDASSDGRNVDPDASGIHWLRVRRPEQVMTPRSLEKLELFESTLRSAAPRLAKRLGFVRPWPGSDLHPTGEDHASKQGVVVRTCAWCLHTIEKRGQRVPAWMRDHSDPIAEGRIVVFKVGDRIVPAERVKPGSLEAAKCDAVFHLCSKTCATDLGEAIAHDRRLRVVH